MNGADDFTVVDIRALADDDLDDIVGGSAVGAVPNGFPGKPG